MSTGTKIELRNVRHFASMSEETNCFNASIYVNGRRAGRAENRGHGGPTDYRFDDPAAAALFKEHVLSLPDRTAEVGGKPFTYKVTGDVLIDILLEEHLRAKEEARFAKIAAKERAKNAAGGFPFTVEIRDARSLMWIGLRTADGADAAVEKMKIKHKLSPATTYRFVGEEA